MLARDFIAFFIVISAVCIDMVFIPIPAVEAFAEPLRALGIRFAFRFLAMFLFLSFKWHQSASVLIALKTRITRSMYAATAKLPLSANATEPTNNKMRIMC